MSGLTRAAMGGRVSSVRLLSTARVARDGKRMQQVDVEKPEVQQQLGKMQMNFVKKAERSSMERAYMHKAHRRKDWTIAGFCFALVSCIYTYTIYAIKQEKFLDDFTMPDPMEMPNTNKK